MIIETKFVFVKWRVFGNTMMLSKRLAKVGGVWVPVSKVPDPFVRRLLGWPGRGIEWYRDREQEVRKLVGNNSCAQTEVNYEAHC